MIIKNFPHIEDLQNLPKTIEPASIGYSSLFDVSGSGNIIGCTSEKYLYAYSASLAEKDGHFYMDEHNKLTNTSVLREVAALKTTEGKTVDFVYTPDDLHIYCFSLSKDSKYISRPEPWRLNKSQITSGMSCTYNDVTLTYIDHEHIDIKCNGFAKTMKVQEDNKNTYKFLKTKIKAFDGAEGLFIFFEKIAENSKVENFPLFSSCYNVIKKVYFDSEKVLTADEQAKNAISQLDDTYESAIYESTGNSKITRFPSVVDEPWFNYSENGKLSEKPSLLFGMNNGIEIWDDDVYSIIYSKIPSAENEEKMPASEFFEAGGEVNVMILIDSDMNLTMTADCNCSDFTAAGNIPLSNDEEKIILMSVEDSLRAQNTSLKEQLDAAQAEWNKEIKAQRDKRDIER